MTTGDSREQELEESPTIQTHRSRPGRVVFTEEDNPDGWIGTDLTVDLER